MNIFYHVTDPRPAKRDFGRRRPICLMFLRRFEKKIAKQAVFWYNKRRNEKVEFTCRIGVRRNRRSTTLIAISASIQGCVCREA